MDKQIYIYALIDPRTSEIRYIGKTNDLNTRVRRHITEKGRTHRHNWLHQLRDNGLKPIVRVLEIASIENWIEREQYWIAYYRTQGIILLNIADGGNGASGVSPSEETREKLREGSKKSWATNPRTLSEEHKRVFNNKGRKFSLETRQKISNALLGLKRSDETKEKIRLSKTGIKYGSRSKETKEKLSIQKRGELNPNAKLDYNKANAIRKKYALENISCTQLAKEYDINVNQIYRIIKGEAWI